MAVSPLSASQAGAGQAGAGQAGPGVGPAGVGRAGAGQAGAGRVGAWERATAGVGAALGAAGWPIMVYAASRLLLLLVAGVLAVVGRHGVVPEFFEFDSQWFLRLAEHGYPTQPLHKASTLGFLPLYPLVMRAVAEVCLIPLPRAALVTSAVGGLAAAVLVQRLATVWWDERTARRATVVFCLFPGSVVFSMAYAECLTIPLALGCLLALHHRRWWIAGLFAGMATAAEPVALVLVVVCLAAVARQVRRDGWRDPVTRRSVLAPLLAPLGIGGFAVFLWMWTGTPFATLLAQHYGWHQQSEPVALLTLPVTRHLLGHPGELIRYFFTPNVWNGLLGGMFLVLSIRSLLRLRHELSAGALALTLGVAAVALWSVMTPPNARIVLVAFPAVLVWARRLSGRAFALFLVAETVVFVLASALTLTGHMLP